MAKYAVGVPESMVSGYVRLYSTLNRRGIVDSGFGSARSSFMTIGNAKPSTFENGVVVGLLLCVVDSLACILWAWDRLENCCGLGGVATWLVDGIVHIRMDIKYRSLLNRRLYRVSPGDKNCEEPHQNFSMIVWRHRVVRRQSPM